MDGLFLLANEICSNYISYVVLILFDFSSNPFDFSS